MYLVLTTLAATTVAAGVVSARAPKAIPIRVRTKRPVRIVRRR